MVVFANVVTLVYLLLHWHIFLAFDFWQVVSVSLGEGTFLCE